MGKMSYEELELNQWQTEIALAQATIMNCQSRIRELMPMIESRQQELAQGKDKKLAVVKE